MDNTRKVLPFINPSGTPLPIECELCGSLIPAGKGYPVVYKGKIDGYVCEGCFVSTEQVKPTVSLKFAER